MALEDEDLGVPLVDDPNIDVLQFYEDFNNILGRYNIESSLLKRPDGVSYDYLTAFALGPINLQDPSAGIIYKPWRVRTDGRYVYLSGSNVDEWLTEILLIDIGVTANLITEIDLAFTQNGDPVVVAQRSDNLWIYWYDPIIPGFIFQDFGLGRNPRVTIDDPVDTTNSDVEVFYISSSANAIVYRTQRERYAIENVTPITGISFKYIEEVYRGRGLRLHVVYSNHDPVTGTYSLGYLNSMLYPYKMDAEEINVSNESISGLVVLAQIHYSLDEESLDVYHTGVSGLIEVMTVTFGGDDEIEGFISLVSVAITEFILSNTLDAESIDLSNSGISGVIVFVLIINELDVEALDLSNSGVSGAIVVV